MNSVSSLLAVVTGSYQDACSHGVAAAMDSCMTFKSRGGMIPVADMEELNYAVEQGLSSSAALATVYCETVVHFLWRSRAGRFWRGDTCPMAGVGTATTTLVLAAMRSHVDDEETQRHGASALAYFAWINPASIAGMLALGAPETLYTSADTHIASANVQLSVCEALYRIAKLSADGCEALRAGHAAGVATRAKNLYPGSYTELLLSLLCVLN